MNLDLCPVKDRKFLYERFCRCFADLDLRAGSSGR